MIVSVFGSKDVVSFIYTWLYFLFRSLIHLIESIMKGPKLNYMLLYVIFHYILVYIHFWLVTYDIYLNILFLGIDCSYK